MRRNRRRKSVNQLLLLGAQTLLTAAIISALIFGVYRYGSTDFLDVQINWQIDKSPPINKEQLEDDVSSLIQNKYWLDLNKIKQAIEQEPWVLQAKVRRRLWNNLDIKIVSQQVALRWGDVGYISNLGELFIPQKLIQSNAVQVFAPNDKAIITKIYKDYLRYQSILSPMSIKAIHVTNIDKLIVEPNITVILGHKMQYERLTRFKKAYNKLSQKTSKIKAGIFDMRYSKGFALSYSKPVK